MMKPVLLAALFLAAAPVLAQTAPPATELQALEFYSRSGDQAATAAELRRLQMRYPGWVPPSDLGRLAVTAPSTEIDDFYRKLAAGQLDQARATLAATRTAWPDWTPPSEMTSALALAEGQVALDQALTAGDAAQARRVAGSTPGLLRCDRINNAWRLAEAQAAAGQTEAALGTYRAIAAACTAPADLVATLEKADPVATRDELRQMASQMTERLPGESAQFTTVLERLMAGRGGATAAPAPAPTARATRPARNPAAGGGGGGGGSTAPRSETPAQCAARTNGARAPATVLQRAWCVYDLNRPHEAIADFQTALNGRLSAAQRRDGRYGLALAHLKLSLTEEASRIAATTDFTRAQRIEIESQILDQRGVQAYRAKRYREAIRYLDALEQIKGSMRRDLAILRAYAYLNAGENILAAQEFRRLNAQLSTEETRNGLAAATGN